MSLLQGDDIPKQRVFSFKSENRADHLKSSITPQRRSLFSRKSTSSPVSEGSTFEFIRRQSENNALTFHGEPFPPEHDFTNADGLHLWTEVWRPNPGISIKALVFVSHGYGEYCSGYYDTLAHFLVEIGCIVLAHDHLYHGLSQGEHWVIKDMHAMTRDIIDHIEHFLNTDFKSETSSVKTPGSSLPIFLYGHSMGGLLAIVAALRRPDLFLNGGVILDSALMVVPADAELWYKKAALFTLATLFPRGQLPPTDNKWLSRDEEVVRARTEDPLLATPGVRFASLKSMFEMIREMHTLLHTFSSPVLILHGSDDHMCPLQGVELFVSAVRDSCADVHVEIFQDAYHQLRKELPDVRERYRAVIVKWMNQRLGC